MKRALLSNYVWISNSETTGGILVCLRTARIVGTMEPNGAGWRGRAFVSPIRFLKLWRKGMIHDFAIETSRKGLAIVSKRRDENWVRQDVELWVCCLD